MVSRLFRLLRGVAGGYARLCVSSYTVELVGRIERLYGLLAGVGGYYVFECWRGRCSSRIEVPRSYAGVVESIPGIVFSRSRSCSDGPLLPPPRSASVGGRAFLDTNAPGLGVIIGFSGVEPVYLPIEDLYRHVAILGATGSGKTHTAARIAACASLLGVRVVIVDWHGEYPSLLERVGARYTVLRGSKLPRVAMLSELLLLEESIAGIEKVLELSQFQSTLLAAVLALGSRPKLHTAKSLTDVLAGRVPGDVLDRAPERLAENTLQALLDVMKEMYQSLNEASKAEKEIWLAVIRRLSHLAMSDYADLIRLYGGEPLAETRENPVVLDVSSIRSPRIRKLYTLLLIQQLYSLALRGKIENTVIVVDEAQHILLTPTVTELLAEARKYGLGLVAVTQSPRLIEEYGLHNFNTIIVHRLSSANDRAVAAQLLGDRDLADIIGRLKPGEAIVSMQQAETPIPITVRLEKPCS
ncbi:ATP-binding protein [Hyperthermus butylicus]|uniref:ATP-binding protein n=1 Tax=Hyperthermus butylicus TaxID=54248 RepID=UPI001891B3B2|nr:ATP-binding protein [Hyperthermus butylicus]